MGNPVQLGSPCIDAGDNTATQALVDLDGNPRIVDGDGDGTPVVDMGAYEFQGVDAIPTEPELGMVIMTMLALTAGTVVCMWRRVMPDRSDSSHLRRWRDGECREQPRRFPDTIITLAQVSTS